MRRIALSVVVLGLAFPFLATAPAQAQATRTWVSGVGDDVNPCSRTAPCKTFAGAISKTALNGEINCLDPGGFGAVTITKSITIDCHEIFASILNSGTNGINVPFDSFNAALDTRKTVRLRNLNLNGANTGVVGIRITGGSVVAAGAVFIEDCLIEGNFAGAARGISDERSNGGELYVTNTTVRNMGATAIAVAPASGGVTIQASINNVRAQNSNFGVAAGNGTRVMVSNSDLSGNTGAGVEADPGAEVNVSASVMSGNGNGVQSLGGTIRLSNNDIFFNGTGISGASQSYRTNRIQTVSPGTAPTAIGAAQEAFGLQ